MLQCHARFSTTLEMTAHCHFERSRESVLALNIRLKYIYKWYYFTSTFLMIFSLSPIILIEYGPLL